MTRYWLSIGVLLLVVTFLAGCVPAAAPAPSAPAAPPPAAPAKQISPEEAAWARVVDEARREGKVVLYGSSWFAGDAARALQEAFKDRYGITVEMLVTTGRVSLEKVQVEQQMKTSIADLVAGGLSLCYDLVRLGLTVPLGQDLPEFNNLDVFDFPELVFGMGRHSIFYGFSQSDLLVNAKLVPPQNEPKSYRDLLKPEWKGGKMVIQDPRGGGSGTYSWFITMTYYNVLDFDYFRRFMAQGPTMGGIANIPLFQGVARGEWSAFPTASVDTVGYMMAEGAPLKLLAMEEGSILSGQCIQMIKNTSHPNAAKLFTNWLLSKDGQTVHTGALKAKGVRKDVPDFTPARIRPEPKRGLSRGTEVNEKGTELLKAGILEEIFGRK